MNASRNGLFHGNTFDRLKAKHNIVNHIDLVVNASYGEYTTVEN